MVREEPKSSRGINPKNHLIRNRCKPQPKSDRFWSNPPAQLLHGQVSIERQMTGLGEPFIRRSVAPLMEQDRNAGARVSGSSGGGWRKGPVRRVCCGRMASPDPPKLGALDRLNKPPKSSQERRRLPVATADRPLVLFCHAR